jgi:Holliday junction DNA helicase RuvA
MIEYLRGILDELTPTEATVECGGVGYLCNISLNTYSAIQGKGEVRLFVHEAIREDSWTLYGFATKQERELFVMLISVSGIGGNTARTMLSAFTPSELCDIIMNGNDKLLKTVKGLGTKTAQRIIVDLKDKVLKIDLGSDANQGSLEDAASGYSLEVRGVDNEVKQEAVSALTMLGFAAAASGKVVDKILKADASASVEQVIKQALKML